MSHRVAGGSPVRALPLQALTHLHVEARPCIGLPEQVPSEVLVLQPPEVGVHRGQLQPRLRSLQRRLTHENLQTEADAMQREHIVMMLKRRMCGRLPAATP